MRNVSLQLEHKDEDGVLVLTVQADRSDAANAIFLKDQFRDATENTTGRVVMDLDKVNFMDSSGLGAVVAALKLLGGRKLELAHLQPAVSKVFTLTRMDKVFILHASLDAAFNAIDDSTAA